MLACLPGPGELPLQLLPHTQMNTGLQKWDTTQRMRSTPFPTPAELDAYAKKIANNPLTIKIFPNSVKVPQRNHVRRTVNGLDTSGQRYSPYPSSQANGKTGLLAIVKGPAAVKGVLKDFAGGRARPHPEVIMNHLSGGPYHAASTSTLNHPHPHPTLPELPRPQQNLGPLSGREAPQTLQMPLGQQQSLRHPLSMAQHSQGLPRLQTVSQPLSHPQAPSAAAAVAAAVLLQQQQQQQHLQQGGRKPPDGEAPPNVTVSTSSIPLPMATGLHQSRQPDLSAIVHQINRFCQARAAQGGGSASMCEGQIANPSPISRNLLISACSRVSAHNNNHHNNNNPAVAFPPHSCVLGPQDKVAATVPAGAHPLPLASATMNHLPCNHAELEQPHPQQQHHLRAKANQQLQHKMRPWSQHPLGPMPHLPNGCKRPSREAPFPFKGMAYPADAGRPYMGKTLLEKATPSPPVNHNGMTGPVAHYPNGHYFQSHVWNNGGVLSTPNGDSSGSQDMSAPFHGAGPGACGALDCGPPGAPHYRLLASSSAQTNLMQCTDYMGGDFQTPYFRDQNLALIGKMHRPPVSGVGSELQDGRGALVQHPGYR
ncbi:protein FAM222B [Stigmatopora nigra]